MTETMYPKLYSVFIVESCLIFMGGMFFFALGFSGWPAVLIALCWGWAAVWPSYFLLKVLLWKRDLKSHTGRILMIDGNSEGADKGISRAFLVGDEDEEGE